MMKFLKTVCCCQCFKRTRADPTIEMDETTILLPINRMQPETKKNLEEKNEILFFGHVPEPMWKNSYDMKAIGSYEDYEVEKIVFSDVHCVIMFKNKKKELGVFGSNENGQLGIEYKTDSINTIDKLVITEVKINLEGYSGIWFKPDYSILDIAAGSDFTLVLVQAEDDKKTFVYRFSIIDKDKIDTNHFFTIKSLDVIHKEEMNYLKIGRIQKIFVSGIRILLLTEENSIYVKGCLFTMEIVSQYKLVQHFDRINPIVDIQLGNNHCVLLTKTKQLYSVGHNEYGEIGIIGSKATMCTQFTPITFFAENNLAIKKIAAAGRHTLVLTDNGKVFAFGDNSDGQCTGYEKNYTIPTEVKFPIEDEVITDICCGYNHSVALTITGEVYTWGDNMSCKLGYPSSKPYENFPKMIPFLNLRRVRKIFAGINQTALLISKDDSKKVEDETTQKTITLNIANK